MIFVIFLPSLQSYGEPETNDYLKNCINEGIFLDLSDLPITFEITEYTIDHSNNSLTIMKTIDESSTRIEDLLDNNQNVSEGILFSCVISEDKSFQINTEIFHGITVNSIKQKASQTSITEEISFNFYDNKQSSFEETVSKNSEQVIPQWIKNQGKWWASYSISDKEFVNSIEYLINEKIIIVPQDNTSDTVQTQKEIPDWIRKTVQWWSEDITSDKEMINALQFLIKIGVIEI